MTDDSLRITLEGYEIVAYLSPHKGRYLACVYTLGLLRLLAEFDEDSPALAIGKCKQWIAENSIIESDEVQA